LQRFFVRINRLLYGLILLMTLLSVADFVLLLAFGWGNTTVIYWLAMSGAQISAFALPLVFICTVYFLINLTLFRKPTDVLLRRISARMLLLSLIAGAFLCGAYLVAIWQTGILGHHEHVAAVQLDTYTYNLQFNSPDYAESYTQNYRVYECQFSLFCREIYSVLKTTGGLSPDVETIEMVPDVSAHMLYVNVNGTVALSHHPGS